MSPVQTSSRVPDISSIATTDDAARLAANNPVGMLQAIAQHERERQAGLPAFGAAGAVMVAETTFVETPGAGEYRATIHVPAGATLRDIQIRNLTVWGAATSAFLDVGDANDPDGWWSHVDLKDSRNHPVNGAMRFGEPGGLDPCLVFDEGGDIIGVNFPAYQDPTYWGSVGRRFTAEGFDIVGVITTVGGDGSTGRTRLLVEFCRPVTVLAVKM